MTAHPNPTHLPRTTAQVLGNRRRALKALDYMAQAQYELIRWRMVLNALPATGAINIRRRAEQEIEETVNKLNGYRSVVWRGLGYDPSSEPPAPRRHWDKGAMEDPEDEAGERRVSEGG